MKNLFITPIILSVFLMTSCGTFAQKAEADITVQEFSQKAEELNGVQLLDVRTPDEWAGGIIEGAIQIDWYSESFVEQLSKLDKEKPVIVYCASGNRSGKAQKKMIELGFKEVYNLAGGYSAWSSQQ